MPYFDQPMCDFFLPPCSYECTRLEHCRSSCDTWQSTCGDAFDSITVAFLLQNIELVITADALSLGEEFFQRLVNHVTKVIGRTVQLHSTNK